MAVARMKGKGGIPGGLLSGDVRQTNSNSRTQNEQSMEMKATQEIWWADEVNCFHFINEQQAALKEISSKEITTLILVLPVAPETGK